MTVDYFAELGRAGGRFPDLKDTDAVTTCYHFLVATGHKKDKDTGADALRSQWGNGRLSVTLPEPDAVLWQWIATPTVDLSLLPTCSFTLRFTFTLAQPYLSKDDNPFYVIDNPIVRDRLFGLPLVRPSSWKGNLASALRQLGQNEGDVPWQRLFGKVNEANDEGQAGRLIFFPTFFTQTGLEIINPHDRRTRVGKNPILFESVPIGAKGTFTLLYVPFDRVGKEQQETAAQVAEDLPLLAKGLQAMFTVYGFSAKRTSGFGLAKETVSDGKLEVNVTEPIPQLAKKAAADFAAGQLEVDVAEFCRRFGLDEFPHWTNAELEKSGWGGKRQSEYKRLRARHSEWDNKAGAWQGAQQPNVEPPPSTPPCITRPFTSFNDLVIVANLVAQQLSTGGAQ